MYLATWKMEIQVVFLLPLVGLHQLIGIISVLLSNNAEETKGWWHPCYSSSAS